MIHWNFIDINLNNYIFGYVKIRAISVVIYLIFNIVIFIDKPGAPEAPLQVTDIQKDSVNLSWNPPRDDGGSEIT